MLVITRWYNKQLAGGWGPTLLNMKKSMNHCIWAAFGPGRPLAFRFGAEELSSSLINSLALKAHLGWWMQPNLHHGYQMIFQSTHQNFWWNYTFDIIWLYYLDQYASFMVPLNYKLHVNNRCWICWISSLIIIKYMEQKNRKEYVKSTQSFPPSHHQPHGPRHVVLRHRRHGLLRRLRGRRRRRRTAQRGLGGGGPANVAEVPRPGLAGGFPKDGGKTMIF